MIWFLQVKHVSIIEIHRQLIGILSDGLMNTQTRQKMVQISKTVQRTSTLMIAPFGPAHQEDSTSDEIDETRLEIYSKHWLSASWISYNIRIMEIVVQLYSSYSRYIYIWLSTSTSPGPG